MLQSLEQALFNFSNTVPVLFGNIYAAVKCIISYDIMGYTCSVIHCRELK